MCEAPKVSKTRDHEVASTSAEKRFDMSEKPANTVVEKGPFDCAKSIDPGEPPQKPIEKPIEKHSFMITFHKWRRGIFSKEPQICKECRIRLSEALRESKLVRMCKSEDDAAKIEAGEGIVKKFRQNCADGLCKDFKSSENRKVGRPHKAKAGSGFEEGSLDLQVIDRVTSLSTPFGTTGEQFLATVEASQQAQLAKQAEIAKSLKMKLPDAHPKTLEDKPAHSSLTHRPELIGNNNPKLSAFSDEGRLEKVKDIEDEVNEFARSVKKSSLPKDQPKINHLIGLRIEGMAYKYSTSLIAYLQKVQTTINMLRNQKAILEWKVDNNRPRVCYEKDFLKMLKGEPAVIVVD